MKKLIVLLLAALLVFNLCACSKTTTTQMESSPTLSPITSLSPTFTPESTAKAEPTVSEDPEILRAIELDIVPESLQRDLDKTISYKEFTQLLDNFVVLFNKDLLPQWKEQAKMAAVSDQKMQRQDGMLELFYAARLMGIDQTAQYDDGIPIPTEGSVWEKFRWSYPRFPNWEEKFGWQGDEENKVNYMAAGYFYSFGRHSRLTAKHLFDYDKMAGCSMHVDKPFTRSAAILAVVRLYDSAPHYVLPQDVGTYQPSKETLDLANAMPPVTSSALPQWHGRELELHNWGHVNGLSYFPIEKDIAEIASYGFNYVRLEISNYFPYEYSDSLTAQTDKGFVFDTMVLESIAKMLDYCAKYKIHVCLSMKNVPGFGCLWEGDQDLLENPEHYQQAMTIWKTVSAYFADVPSELLSYELINEPCNIFTQETYTAFANECIAIIRAQDRQNKVMISDGIGGPGYPDAGVFTPIDSMESGILQAIHFYPFNADRMSQFISLLNWPFDEAPVVNATYRAGHDPLTLLGDFAAGSQVVLYIREAEGINKGATLELLADGKIVDSYTLDGIKEGADGYDFKQGNWASFGKNGTANGYKVMLKSAQAAQKLEVVVKTGGDTTSVVYREALIQTPSDSEKTYYVPDNGHEGMLVEKGPWNSTYLYFTLIDDPKAPGSTVTVEGDGTFTASPAFEDTYVFDYNFMKKFFAQWAAWSKKTGTPIIVNEFYVPSLLPASVKEAYLESFLGVLKEYGIPWSYYTSNDCGPLIVSNLHPEMWSLFNPDMGYERKGNFYYDTAAMGALQKFMK